MGSVLNVRGNLYDYNTSEEPDEIAIAHDWNMVGQDILGALEKAPESIGSLPGDE